MSMTYEEARDIAKAESAKGIGRWHVVHSGDDSYRVGDSIDVENWQPCEVIDVYQYGMLRRWG